MIIPRNIPGIRVIWEVTWGKYDNEGFTLFVSETLNRAIQLIKKEGGFTYNKADNLWENDAKNEWYSIDKVKYLP